VVLVVTQFTHRESLLLQTAELLEVAVAGAVAVQAMLTQPVIKYKRVLANLAPNTQHITPPAIGAAVAVAAVKVTVEAPGVLAANGLKLTEGRVLQVQKQEWVPVALVQILVQVPLMAQAVAHLALQETQVALREGRQLHA
jgi:hypothetical protein